MVKICYNNGKTKKFCKSKSLLLQLQNANCVKITVVDDGGESAELFLNRLSDISPFEFLPPINIEVEIEDSILGAKFSRKAKKLKKYANTLSCVRQIVLYHSNLDKQLHLLLNEFKKSIHAETTT